MASIYDSYIGLNPKRSFDLDTALSLAIACQLAYDKAATVRRITKQWGFTDTVVLSKTKGKDIDFQCFVTHDDKNILICVRGSDKIEDWFANFQAVADPGPLKNTYAHEGFQDALFPAVIAISAAIEKFDHHGKNIWLSGHSLGAAQCSLFAGMLIENGYSVHGVYTFASPRPGSQSFADQLNDAVQGPHFRVINQGDVVPHVPPEPFYSHPGRRVILKLKTKATSDGSWMQERIAAIKKFVAMTLKHLDIADNHRLNTDTNSYIPRLKSLKSSR